MEKKSSQGPLRLNINKGHLTQQECLAALPDESHLPLMVFTNRYKDKSIFQINSYVPECADLLQQQNHMWKRNYNWSHHLIKLLVVHCHSGQIPTLRSFKSFQVALISAILPRMQCCFWFTVFLGRYRLPLGLSFHNSLHSMCQKTTVL